MTSIQTLFRLIFVVSFLVNCLNSGPAVAQEEQGSTGDDSVEGENAPPVDESRRKLINGVLDRLTGEDPIAANEAGVALAEIAQPEDLPWLVQALKQGTKPEAQVSIIELLGAFGDTRAAKTLRFEVEYGQPAAKLAAIRALGNIKHSWVVPILLKVLEESKDVKERQSAAASLARLGSGDAIYALKSTIAKKQGTEARELALPIKNTVLWGLQVAEKKVNDAYFDTTVGYGRKAEYLFKGTKYRLYGPSYRPKKGPKPRLLVCVHDADLEIERLFNLCLDAAKESSMALLVPLFDPVRFPDYEVLNFRGERADKRLLELVAYIAADAELETRELFLFGFGAGGDFVQRFAMTYPQRVAKAAFAAKNYTMPDDALLFPEGIRVNLRASDIKINVESFIKSDVAVVVESEQAPGRGATRFLRAVSDIADATGITSRIVQRAGSTPTDAWEKSKDYLIKKN